MEDIFVLYLSIKWKYLYQ